MNFLVVYISVYAAETNSNQNRGFKIMEITLQCVLLRKKIKQCMYIQDRTYVYTCVFADMYVGVVHLGGYLSLNSMGQVTGQWERRRNGYILLWK